MVDAAIIGGLLTNLVPVIRDGFSLFSSFKKDFEKLSSTLSTLHAVLEDAETKIKLEKKDKQTEDWLRKLKDVAYEVRDIMDECTFEDLRLQVERLNSCQVRNCIAHPFINIKKGFKIGHKIKDVLEKVVQISSERANLNLPETRDLNLERSLTVGGRETMSLLSVKVHGRDEDCKGIVEILVNSSKDDKRLSILPIIGIGGLGKTTLAQMVFKDENVVKHFDTKIWVCISDEFDINRVMKDILGEKSEASLEELQKKVRDQLNRKRFLIVLDDVWNEDENEWNKLRSALDCGSDGAFVLVTTRKKIVAEIMKTKQHFELSPLSYDACWLLFEERAFRNETSKTPKLIKIGKEIAKKCKGVPLVAKTLGGNLGFKSDEEEWLRIRDNEIWEISQNEKSILPILRLNYYDLPYLLRRCFAFCAIFPKDSEIEKERLIQLWMAHDLIPINKNQKGENQGNTIWDELCWRSFFQDEKEKISWWGEVKKICKMHDLMHDLAQSIMKDECYTLMDVKSSSEDFGREIRHITIMIDEFTKTSIDSLKKIRGLQSIILRRPGNDKTFSKEILSVLKELPTLRVIEVSNISDIQCQDLHYVGCLKHLRYLDISFCGVKTLPSSICDLLNLQTLNLNDCKNLESLPRNMKDLINLQHLYLDGCRNLRCMPGGMGRLKDLKTLSLFVVGKKNRDGQLDELKELEIRGSLEIKNLGRVSDASIARGISLAKMSSINKLELQWEDDDQMRTRHEKICEALKVSSTCLKILIMRGYKGVNISKLVGMSSATLTQLHLSALTNVKHIFSMNNANTSVSSHEMNGMVVMLFPLLEKLDIQNLDNLRELMSPPIPITTTTIGAFPNLRNIVIINCPKLGALPPHLKSLKHVTVQGEYSDELIDNISGLSGQLITRLLLHNVNERNILFPAVSVSSSNDMNGNVAVTLFPLLEELEINYMENLRELISPPTPITTIIGAFPNLCKIDITRCPKLGALPPNLKSLTHVNLVGECSDELLHSISDLSALTHLIVWELRERSVLFKFGGGNYYKADGIENEKTSSSSSTLATDNNINEAQGGPASSTFQSLRSLRIIDCAKLSCLFDEEGCEKLARGGCLTNLSHLIIIGCPKLMISLEQWRNLGTHSLQYLTISFCPELMISLEQWRNLGTHSLQYLEIRNCPKLVPSKVEEADEVRELLRSLRERLGPNNFYVCCQYLTARS